MTKTDFAPKWRKRYACPQAKTIALDAKAELLIGSTPDQFSRKKDVEFDDTDEQEFDENVQNASFFPTKW